MNIDNQKCEGFERTTFCIKVLSQQNHSWQGTITWVEENKTKNFRSVLELMKLMDSALSEEETTL